MPLTAGDKLGHYRITSLLGQGAMGEVYKTRDTRLDRNVSHEDLPGTVDGFEREVGSVATQNQSRRLLALSCLLMLCSSGAMAQTTSNPQRWQAQYTQIYSDDIETIAPTLTPAFSLGPAGSLTSDLAEVIAGNESIEGSYSGTNTFNLFLQTVPSILALAPNHPYQVTFQYKILTAAANGFQAFLNSSTAQSQGVGGIRGATINGAVGTQGTAAFTATTGSYADYAVLWGINGAGAILIDNIQISDAANGKVIASENAEGTAPGLKSGIQLHGPATVITDPSLVLSGKASILLSNQGGFVTDPSVIPIGANTVYTIKFDYRIVSPTTSNQVLFAWLQPAGTTDQQLQVIIPAMLKNATVTGTFSSGAQTAGASSYVVNFRTEPGVSLIIDNIFVYRQDVTTQNVPPDTWRRLLTAPYPRLGNLTSQRTDYTAALAFNEGTPFIYSVAQIESRLAFSDVIAGLSLTNQTQNPDSIHRIRALNPNVVILPDRFIETESDQAPPSLENIDLDYQLLQSTAKEWKATDTAGNVVYDRNYPAIFFMNLSNSVPAVNGQTWRTALQNYMTTQVLPSGLWDGIHLENGRSVLDPAFPNYDNPALFNYDWNRNSLRDETPAATSEMVRAAKIQMLQQLNSSTNGLQFTMGHTASPEFALSPLVNGYGLECFNNLWSQPGAPITSSSPAGWRTAFEAYLRMQATELPPQTNILEGCGASAADINTPPNSSQHYLTPTADDMVKHRFTLGTALLGNGYYDYDLKDPLSAPYWFDEYSVDSNGTAIEDRAKKGYLGQPLSDAAELTNPGTLVFQEGFDSGALPNSFIGSPLNAVSITQTPGEVISGTGSLALSNPDHTQQSTVTVTMKPSVVPLSAGATYLLTFDWRILETLDFTIGFQVGVSASGQNLDRATVPGVVTGDSGTMHFPFTIPSAGNWTITFSITNGGGRVAIDSVKIYQGGVGPWRRDFENGFVLVNPFNQPRTFSAADLAGSFNRTGIHRIKGTQAPDINTGESVTGSLTLGAFDAIILLADRVNVPGCSYSLNYSAQAFTAQGGTGTITITTGADCPWSVGALPAGVTLTSNGSGIGDGSVTFQVAPNGFSSSFTIAGQTFTIPPPPTGALAHFTAGGIWTTGFFVLNNGNTAAQFSIAFHDDNGNPVALPFSTGSAGTLSGTVAAQGSAYYEASNPLASVVGGSAQITADPSIVVQSLFRENSSGTYYEASVPSSSGSKEFLLPFDATTFAATGQPFYTGVAIANLDATMSNVVCTARNSSGVIIPSAIAVPPLAPLGHWANYLFPALTNNRGTIDCVSNTNIAATAFRFIGTNAFSSLPVIANPANFSSGPNPVLPHFASGGIWTTGFFVLNKGSSVAHFSIALHDDNGNPIALPFSTGTANTLSGTVAAQGLAYYEASNPQISAIGGSGQITADPSIVVQALFRENSTGTYYEAAVPSSSGSKEFLLPFDASTFPANGLPFYTGFAIANLDAATSNVVCTARNSSGNIIPGAISVPPLAPQGHWANYLFPVLTGKRGTIDCVSNTNIAATALRFIGTNAFSSLPVITK